MPLLPDGSDPQAPGVQPAPEAHLAQDGGRPRCVLLWIQFDGTDFHGFQRQTHKTAVQGPRSVAQTLEEAWQAMLGEPIVARSSSRTDAGVHARRMPVLVRTARTVPARGLKLGLNAHLPADLAVTDAQDMPEEFDVRADAVGKRYVYRLTTGEVALPLWRRIAWHVRGPLDEAAMALAAQHLVGVHDFAAFRGAACTAASTVRHMRSIDLQRQGEALTVAVDGNAFLLNMVRIFVGTLVDVGRGRFRPEDVQAMLASGDRRKAGQTAPAHGLTLDDVFFGPAGAKQGMDYKSLLLHMNAARN